MEKTAPKEKGLKRPLKPEMPQRYTVVGRVINPVDAMASEISEAIVMFSTGIDSLVMLDLCSKHFKKIIPVFLYYCDGLKYKDDYLNFIEKKYSVKVLKYPLPEALNVTQGSTFNIGDSKGGKQYKMSDIYQAIRRDTEVSYIAIGYIRQESLQRNGIIKASDNGIDRVNKFLYPIKDFTKKMVVNYQKTFKLPLTVEYAHGFRNIDIWTKTTLSWLRSTFPNDFQTVMETYPLLGAELLRADYEK